MKIESPTNLRRNALGRLVNRILNLFGYHLTKMPTPYTRKKKQLSLGIPPINVADASEFEKFTSARTINK